MKEKLVDMYSDVKAVEEELNSMKSKIKSWTRDIHKVEKNQGKLHQQLQNLGVDIALFSRPSQRIVPGFQDLPHESTPALNVPPHSTAEGTPHTGKVIKPSMNPVMKVKWMKLVGKPVHNVELIGDQQESANPTVEQESEQSTLPGPEGDLFVQQTFSAPEGFPVQKELLNLADAMDATDAEQLA